MNIYICGVCGYVAFNTKPENCPVCGAPESSFKQNDNVFIESEEKSKEASSKHIPAVNVNKSCSLIPEESCSDVIVRIGETLHPSKEEHFIKFIDCYVDDVFVSRMDLTPGVFAAGCFHLQAEGKKVTIVENCNVHGYWMAEAAL